MITKREEREVLDKQRELNVQNYLNRIYDDSHIVFERENHRDEQLSGIDVYFLNNGSKVNIDEKVASRYYFRDLETFSLELSFKRRIGNEHKPAKGWFHDENKKNKTQAYVFGYVRAKDEKDNLLTDIYRLESILVKKSKLWKYLSKCGYPSAEYLLQLFNEAEYLKRLKSYNSCSSLMLNNGLKLVRTESFEECPINILIPKRVLIALSSFHATYKDNKVEIHKNLQWK